MTLNEISLTETLAIKPLGINEFKQAFPVVRQLRMHLTLEGFLALVEAMRPAGYQAACLFEHGEIVSYAGFARQTNLYYGDHIWVFDLVTDEIKRGKGYGKMLLSYIEDHARENSLSCIALSSGRNREASHMFYEKTMDYVKTSYVFRKDINSPVL